MRSDRDTLGSKLATGAIVVLAPLCCIALPLLVAGGVTIGLAAAFGGLLLGGIAVVLVVGLLLLRGRRRGLSRPAPRR